MIIDNGIKYLTYAEIQEKYPISIRTMQRYIKAGRLTKIEVGGKTYIPENLIDNVITRF